MLEPIAPHESTQPQQVPESADRPGAEAPLGDSPSGTLPPRRRRRAASRPAGPPVAKTDATALSGDDAADEPRAAADAPASDTGAAGDAEAAPRGRTRRRATRKATAPAGAVAAAQPEPVAAATPAVTTPADAVADEAAAEESAPRARSRRRATRKATAPAGPAQGVETPAAEVAAEHAAAPEPAAEVAAEAVAEPAVEAEPVPRSRTRRRAVRRTATAEPQEPVADERESAPEPAPATRCTRQRVAADQAAPAASTPEAAAEAQPAEATSGTPTQEPVRGRRRAVRPPTAVFQAPVFAEPMFQTPETAAAAAAAGRQDDAYEEEPAAERATTSSRRRAAEDEPADEADEALADGAAEPEHDVEAEDEGGDRPSRRRRRGGRRRRRGEALDAEGADEHTDGDQAEPADEEQHAEDGEPGAGEDDAMGGGSSSSRRRRRRRRRSGDGADATGGDDPERTVVKIREPRERRAKDVEPSDEVQSIKGSTRLEAKKQRRREGREQGRRRVPIITEAEFLARREAVERVMVVRQSGERTQIGVLEDNVLVEHFVNKEQATSYVANVYLGKVQNVLPSMEAAFVDIGKGRNAVLYAGEVNFEALGMGHGPRRIETALKSGQPVLVQVTKDPIGHKGARLTSQVSLPGRYLVYVPEGSMTGISRKLPDTERARLKQILKKIVPEDAGVIVRTAAEGASEDELTRDVARLQAQWEEIQQKAKGGSSHAPTLLYGEPDMTVRVVRDIFNEDFSKVIVSGDGAWETIHSYVSHVAPDLADRLQKWTSDVDVFATYRIDEQLMKALDRKVWLPSGGSLVIDRTEAMVVVDVNTGKFTGQGGNLEETVTRNNLEAAEEIVRQLRLRDLGGIIVIDFIDMVLESNRDLVLRRLLECLGRDRTKHQLAEMTSLGLVQMTRKRVGQGLLESFSESCVHCNGRGVLVHMDQPTSAGGGGKRGKKKGGADQHEHVHAPAEVERPTAPSTPAESAPTEVTEPAPAEVAAPEAEEEWFGSAAEVQAAAELGRGSAASRRGRRRASRKASAPAGSPRQAEVSAEEPVAQAAAEAPAPAVVEPVVEPTPEPAAQPVAPVMVAAEPAAPAAPPRARRRVTRKVTAPAGSPADAEAAVVVVGPSSTDRAVAEVPAEPVAPEAPEPVTAPAPDALVEAAEEEAATEEAAPAAKKAAKKPPAKKTAAKKTAAKKATAKKATAKKATAKKAEPEAATTPEADEPAAAKKATAKKAAAKKAPAKKAATKKATAKKTATKKTAAAEQSSTSAVSATTED